MISTNFILGKISSCNTNCKTSVARLKLDSRFRNLIYSIPNDQQDIKQGNQYICKCYFLFHSLFVDINLIGELVAGTSKFMTLTYAFLVACSKEMKI